MKEKREQKEVSASALILSIAVLVAAAFVVVWVFKSMWDDPPPPPEEALGARLVPKMPLYPSNQPGVIADLGELSVTFPNKPALATETIIAPAGNSALEVRAYRADARDVESWTASFTRSHSAKVDAGDSLGAAENAVIQRMNAIPHLKGARVISREDAALTTLPGRDISVASDEGYSARAQLAVSKSGKLYALVVIEPTAPSDGGTADLDMDANAFFATAKAAP